MTTKVPVRLFRNHRKMLLTLAVAPAPLLTLARPRDWPDASAR